MPEHLALLARTTHSLRATDKADGYQDPGEHIAHLVLALHEDTHPGPARWCAHEACQVAAAWVGGGPDKP